MDRFRHTYRALALRSLLASMAPMFIAGHAGCLSLNPSYKASDSQTGPAGGGTQRVDGEETGNPNTPTQGETTSSNPTLTSIPSGQNPSTGSSGAWITTSVPTTYSGWTTSETSSATSTGSPTRRGIEIGASSVTETLSAGYPFSLTFDHRAMVNQGAKSDGSDLAVISERGGQIVSLPRVLDRASGWNQSNTTIWFTINTSVAAGSTVSDGYYLVTQDPSVTPDTQVSKVFVEFEDFGGRALDAARWRNVTSSEGTHSMNVDGGRVVLTATPSQDYEESYFGIRRIGQSIWPNLRIDVMTRFTKTGDLSGTCGRVFPIRVTSAGNNTLRTALRSDASAYAALSFSDAQAANQVTAIANHFPQYNTWSLHSLTWRDTDIRYWGDGVQMIATQSQSSVTRPNQTNLQLEFSVGARKSGCTGSGTLGLEIDWYRMRRYTFPEPTTRLK